ncbi:UNVERIFIED_CONTAM: hypothetical protein Slati_0468100 [Sesamum latifolium]|uniref:Myb/SANT-like domain-containing protein n=1 Tax=Sesamum latifolium TaxID=2727402 RepID=A0AAW2XWN5_9LAMI
MFRLVSSSDETCLQNLRMDRNAFGRLCYLLEHSAGLKPLKISQCLSKCYVPLCTFASQKNCVVKHNFIRSGHTISKHFYSVLHAVCMMHRVLLVKPTPIADDYSDPRWKWFKGCLGALDGTFINVRVPEHEKGRYRTRKGDIAVNVLGVCNPNMQFIFVLSGWEGTMDTDFISTAHVNILEDEGSSQQKRRGHNKDRTGPRRTWTMLEEEALINGLKALVMTGWKCDNGFRNGYLAQLEAHMKRAFPQCHIKAEPHINSKLHVWKKQYSTLCSMMAKSSLGWDDSRNMVTVEEDNAWSEFVKGINEEPPQSNNINCDPTVNSSSATKRTPSSRKRKATEAYPKYRNCALESEFGDPSKRGVVMEAVREIDGLEENDVLVVTTKLVHDPQSMEIFFNLSQESKAKMERLILD